ncbi:MAG: fused MFS/spermidine synthase [Bdellovibrionaceae bacterium]|nr:fused MFS/spermidine synthase [Pseudobdellovibrionaceae bacterium]
MLILFSFAILISSSLLFLVQPMAGKILLPIFGGSHTLWITCLLFFQTVLLLGYGASHFIVKKLSWNLQRMAVSILLILSLVQLFFWQNNMAWDLPFQVDLPQVKILILLSLTVGLSYFSLSLLSPTLQFWLGGKNPYVLYVFSNVGSLLALLSYPFVMEYFFTTGQQVGIYILGFLFLSTFVFTIFYNKKLQVPELEIQSLPIARGQKLRWLWLSLSSTAMMMSVTNYLSSVLLPLPLLWILPLSIYLLSFALAFTPWDIIKLKYLQVLSFLFILILAIFILGNVVQPLSLVLVVHFLGLFILCFLCHRSLYLDRPSVGHLTQFYLWIAVGGVLAGFLISFVAPIAFNSIAEYPYSLVFVAVTFLNDLTLKDIKRIQYFGWVVLLPILFYFLPFKAESMVVYFCLLFLLRKTPLVFLLAFCSGLWVWSGVMDRENQVHFKSRSFYGAFQVLQKKDPQRHVFVHGQTLHGIERIGESPQALGYYHQRSPLAEVFNNFSSNFHEVAVIGLGIGSMACYSRPEQNWNFIEIDSEIVKLATQSDLFTTYNKCFQGQGSVVVGDGRKQLEKEGANKYDIIIVDAFNSDAIPFHLLTKEALSLYESRLKLDGLILFHVSNRFLDLSNVLGNLAKTQNKVALYRDVQGDESTDFFASEWVLLISPKDERRQVLNQWFMIEANEYPIWTDQYSSVLRYFK